MYSRTAVTPSQGQKVIGVTEDSRPGGHLHTLLARRAAPNTTHSGVMNHLEVLPPLGHRHCSHLKAAPHGRPRTAWCRTGMQPRSTQIERAGSVNPTHPGLRWG